MHQLKNRYFIFIILLFCSIQAFASCSEWLAKAVSIQGKVDAQLAGSFDWVPININYQFCSGDKVRTSKHSKATLVFRNGPTITLSHNSTLSFTSKTEKKASWVINIIKGLALIRSRETQRLNVQTPFINVVHDGTEFLVKVTKQQAEITVLDGLVSATNQRGKIRIKKGFIGIADNNQTPWVRELKIYPEDAIQWSLYYPPIIDVGVFQQPTFQASIKAYREGKLYQALNLLGKVTKSKQDVDYLTLKASLLLSLGSVDESISQINQGLLREPDKSGLIALQAIIAVSKNKSDVALKLAQKAVKLDPQSATAQIALSYAHQTQFEILKALLATKEAVRLSADNALAWARLAELQLSNGKRSEALRSAKQAERLNPSLGQTQIILGFNYLAQTDVNKAKEAFSHAIKLNSADPLAYLGLGLAKIRRGAVEEGKQDIETAVSLDPDNAIMRSYLGKAYYELRNNEYAATELKIAKEMDPKDPTPWFYDAIRKQTINQPVDALHDMQKAVELNDNRGVYRSKLLLDEDVAARSANMARIYQDLGLDRVALKQAWTSLGQDYSNPSAHRFLSDTLQGKSKHRIARASELLQAQLFQPINMIPVQPQLTNENIGILNSTGPSSLSSNEYDALFTSNGAHILLNGAVGSNNTLTDNAIVSGVYDQLSFSFGQFHYQTDGFRVNDDYKKNIYNAFAQLAVTENLNVQLEFKREDVAAGDVALHYSGEHQEKLRESVGQDTARFGLHYKIASDKDFIFSVLHTDFKEKNDDDETTIIQSGRRFKVVEQTKDQLNTDSSGYQLETQFLFHNHSFNLLAGIGYLNLNNQVVNRKKGSRDTINIETGKIRKSMPIFDSEIIDGEIDFFNSYIYSKIKVTPTLTSILGVSFDSFSEGEISKSQFNPKIGFIWNPLQNLTFRAAAFRTLKRPLVSNQTIELTQIAGFNQFFDGNDATTAWQYGVGLDFQLLNDVYLGGEVFWRDTLKQVHVSTDGDVSINSRRRDEISHLAYLYWTPANWVSITSEYHYDKFRREFKVGAGDLSDPRGIETHSIPIKLNLFHSKGIFSTLTANYVNQKAEYVRSQEGRGNASLDPLEVNSSDFWTFDTSLGYRLPKKIGSLSIEVRNLFDNQGFKYNSTFDASGPQLTQFVPEREIFFKLNLSY